MPPIVDSTAEYDDKRVQLYNSIKEYASAGYTKRNIAKILHCSRNTVTKYLTDDFDALCRKDFHSGADKYYDFIIKSLEAGMSRKDVYRTIILHGYKGGQTAAYDYMNRIIDRFQIDVAIYKSSTPEAIQKKKSLEKYDHISRSGVFRFLWMGLEITAVHKIYLMNTYPKLKELYVCIREFRQIFTKKNMSLLYLFIEKYKKSELKLLVTFANGLEKDISAVENSVASPLSNGLVEGNNSKLKMVKRTMYGRCSRELLEAKLIYSPKRING
ncbi:MAG: transposase [Velocimicrobium sp.]